VEFFYFFDDVKHLDFVVMILATVYNQFVLFLFLIINSCLLSRIRYQVWFLFFLFFIMERAFFFITICYLLKLSASVLITIHIYLVNAPNYFFIFHRI